MLCGRAHHYDVGVVGIEVRDTKTQEEFGHALNAIVTLEGLVIDPLYDYIWPHSGITNGTEYEFPWFENPVYVEEVRIVFDY